jgi:hypothetical protein
VTAVCGVFFSHLDRNVYFVFFFFLFFITAIGNLGKGTAVESNDDSSKSNAALVVKKHPKEWTDAGTLNFVIVRFFFCCCCCFFFLLYTFHHSLTAH